MSTESDPRNLVALAFAVSEAAQRAAHYAEQAMSYGTGPGGVADCLELAQAYLQQALATSTLARAKAEAEYRRLEGLDATPEERARAAKWKAEQDEAKAKTPVLA